MTTILPPVAVLELTCRCKTAIDKTDELQEHNRMPPSQVGFVDGRRADYEENFVAFLDSMMEEFISRRDAETQRRE